MNVLRTAGTTVAVLALAFGAAAPVYAASAPAVVSHVAVAPADGPSGGDRGWGHPHGGVWAGGGAMANSVSRLTSHIGG